MTHPNELQQLEEDLAAGLLSPEDYRRRRDELNGTASGSPPEASPFPPAFRWESSTSEGATQVMQAVGRDVGGADPADATQVVRAGEVYPPSPFYQQRPDELQDLFRPAGGPPQSSAPPQSSTPPWAHSDPPPIAEAQNAWRRQGPEAFKAPAMQSRSTQIVGIAVLSVLVAALVGAGVAYFLTAGSPSQPDQAGSTQPAPQLPAPPLPARARELPAPPVPSPAPIDTAQALITPPGQSRGGGGLLDLPRLATSSDLLPPSIVTALRAGEMTDGVLKTTTVGGSTIGMYAFAVRDERAATDVVRTITTVQRDGGLAVDDSHAQQGVTVLGTGPAAPSTVYRAVYVLYNRVIFLEVLGPDRDSVLPTFDAVVNQQVTHAPPTVRTGR